MAKNRLKIETMIKFLVVILSSNMVMSQDLESFMQKTTLENSLRDKIYSEVGHVIDKTKFVVVVNLDLDNGSSTTDLKSTQVQTSGTDQTSDLTTEVSSVGNSMDFIPGFQFSGSNNESESNNQVNKPTAAVNKKGIFGNFGSLKIKKIGVNFFLEESLASPALDKTITKLVNGIIPMISNCNDCISIETMQFHNSSEKSELALLRAKVDSIEVSQRKQELSILNNELKDLKDQLMDLESDNDSYLQEFKLDKAFQRTQDSLRLLKLEAKENAEREQLDTLLLKAQHKIDTVINARIESETETKKDLIDIIKYGQGNLSDEDSPGILGMKGGGASNSTLIYLGLGGIIVLMFMLLFFKKNKQEVVYLKPKGASKKNNEKNKQVEAHEEKDEASKLLKEDELPIVPEAPTNPYATMAFEDENVMRAELKALRQSAVSMSANQREGATQIVKDWLSDNESEAKGDEG